MKTCSLCHAIKSEAEFYKRTISPDGLQARCKACDKAEALRWARDNADRKMRVGAARYKNNKNRLDAEHKQWREEHKERHAGIMARSQKKWATANPEKVRARALRWQRNNKAKLAIWHQQWKRANRVHLNRVGALRRAQQLRAIPAWANQGYIEDVYRKAAIFTKRDGTPWHVDHIVPLKSKLVCGLHCEDNLQVLPGSENAAKKNSYWPDMPAREAGSPQ